MQCILSMVLLTAISSASEQPEGLLHRWHSLCVGAISSWVFSPSRLADMSPQTRPMAESLPWTAPQPLLRQGAQSCTCIHDTQSIGWRLKRAQLYTTSLNKLYSCRADSCKMILQSLPLTSLSNGWQSCCCNPGYCTSKGRLGHAAADAHLSAQCLW